MKKVFVILELTDIKICQPSSDYYARNNDWDQGDIQNFIPLSERFESEDEAISQLNMYEKGQFIILPMYIK